MWNKNQVMSIIHAIYENGVFKPTEPVSLPEHCIVRVEPEIAETGSGSEAEDSITEALNRVYGTGKDSGALDPGLLRAQAMTLKKNSD